jgi:YVTN family beta-propeller protein
MSRFSTLLTLAACAAAVVSLTAVAGRDTTHASLPGAQGTVWVANRGLHNVSAFDAASGAVAATIAVGREPNSLTLPPGPGRGKVYVSDEASNTVSVIDTGARTVVKTIPVGARPHHISSSRDGRRVYVAEFGTNKIGVIDTQSDTLVAEFVTNPSSATRTHMAYPTWDGKLLLAANEVANEIAVLDAASGTRLAGVSIGNRPSEAIATRDGKLAYASVRNENKLKRIDLTTRAITGEIVVGTQPDTMQLAPDGRTLFVALRGNPAQLSIVDLASFTLVKTIDLAGVGTLAAHNWLSASGRYSYVAFEGPGAGVAVVDHRTNTVVGTYPYPGGGRPHGAQLDDPAALRPQVSVTTRSARAAGGMLRLVVQCGEATAGRCSGRLEVGSSGRRLGGATFDVRAGESRPVALRLRGFAPHARAFVTVTDALENSALLSWPLRLAR